MENEDPMKEITGEDALRFAKWLKESKGKQITYKYLKRNERGSCSMEL